MRTGWLISVCRQRGEISVRALGRAAVLKVSAVEIRFVLAVLRQSLKMSVMQANRGNDAMKPKIILAALCALIAGIYPALAQPTLSIAPAGNQALLFWPTTVTNYVLQSTTNLAAPNWATVSNAILVTISNAFPMTAVTITHTPPANFFHLFQNTNKPITTSDGMALIPAGSFTMGDTLDSETDAIPVSVTVSAFYMDKKLVSYSQWQSVYNWATNNGYEFIISGSGNAANQPVQTVTWYDCVVWCNARSVQAGLTPVYYADAGFTQIYTISDGDAVYPNWAANGYRLPTEAEWEKAARGGLSGKRFPWGNTISESQANYFSETYDYSYDLGPNGLNAVFAALDAGDSSFTSPVGYFAPNGYGLFDMAGNVEEWCWDWAGVPYGQPTTVNPTGPASPSPFGSNGFLVRVLRGGFWAQVASSARCAARASNEPGAAANYIGFRCVRGL
jgi:formylglycine-generating enzyme required for sulfatase activity